MCHAPFLHIPETGDGEEVVTRLQRHYTQVRGPSLGRAEGGMDGRGNFDDASHGVVRRRSAKGMRQACHVGCPPRGGQPSGEGVLRGLHRDCDAGVVISRLREMHRRSGC